MFSTNRKSKTLEPHHSFQCNLNSLTKSRIQFLLLEQGNLLSCETSINEGGKKKEKPLICQLSGRFCRADMSELFDCVNSAETV